MFIRSIGFFLPNKKVSLGRNKLSKKLYFENVERASYHVAEKLETPATLAEKAAKDAMHLAKAKPADVRAVVYTQSLLKDFQSWSQAADLCNRLGIKNSSFIDIYQGCTGMLSSFELIQNSGSLKKTNDTALAVTSGILPKKFGNHLDLDRGGICSDGSACALLSSSGGKYKILSIDIKYNSSCNDFIKLPYGGHAFAISGKRAGTFELQKIKKEFTGKIGEGKILEAFSKIHHEAIFGALLKAELLPKQISFVVLPNYCPLYNSGARSIFKHLPESAFSIKTGMEVSHTGAGDILINLRLMEKSFRKGDLIALMQDGAGISAACAILEVC